VLSEGTELLMHAFGASRKILPSLGNHDTFPAESFAPDSFAPIYAAMEKIRALLLPQGALKTVALGGYYRYTNPLSSFVLQSHRNPIQRAYCAGSPRTGLELNVVIKSYVQQCSTVLFWFCTQHSTAKYYLRFRL
jgi:hypothetical protein